MEREETPRETEKKVHLLLSETKYWGLFLFLMLAHGYAVKSCTLNSDARVFTLPPAV